MTVWNKETGEIIPPKRTFSDFYRAVDAAWKEVENGNGAKVVNRVNGQMVWELDEPIEKELGYIVPF